MIQSSVLREPSIADKSDCSNGMWVEGKEKERAVRELEESSSLLAAFIHSLATKHDPKSTRKYTPYESHQPQMTA